MFGKKKKDKGLTDTEVIEGIQSRNQAVEKHFYLSCKNYFAERKSSVVQLAAGAKEEHDLFQDSFLKLWQEIQTRQIFVHDNFAWRVDRNGESRKMSASLKTYLMAIAKYKNYENFRDEDIYSSVLQDIAERSDEDQDSLTSEWIVDVCVNALPHRCKEILTLFYYEGKSLDQILEIRSENQSKDGLKTAKAKCMKSLKDMVKQEFVRRHLKPYYHA